MLTYRSEKGPNMKVFTRLRYERPDGTLFFQVGGKTTPFSVAGDVAIKWHPGAALPACPDCRDTQLEKGFLNMIRALRCPGCGTFFSDPDLCMVGEPTPPDEVAEGPVNPYA